jgi:hypothetical protein
MPIYDLLIYDRFGQCLLHRHFNQPPQLKTTSATRAKLLFGLVYTMQAFVNTVSPVQSNSPPTTTPQASTTSTPVSTALSTDEPLLSFNTPQYKVHHFVVPTGLRFLMTTDLKATTQTDLLKKIYKLFVDLVTSTPHYTQGIVPAIPHQFDVKLVTLLDPLLQT